MDIGEISYFRYGDPLFQGTELVIRDKGLWEWFWRVHKGLPTPSSFPQVDFPKEMVIVVILGFQTSGGGPKVEISSIEEWMGDSLVTNKRLLKKNSSKGVRVTAKESREPGPLDVITNPYHIVKVKNISSVMIEHWPLDQPCNENSQCGAEEYCEKKMGDCGGAGICKMRPEDCPLYFRYDPVCGCDGKTYDSECAAAVQGVSVLRKGTCEEHL
jgi:hypothetical protein